MLADNGSSATFDRLDVDQNGKLSLAELKNAVIASAKIKDTPVSDEAADEIVRKCVALYGGGGVDRDQFHSFTLTSDGALIFKPLTSLVDAFEKHSVSPALAFIELTGFTAFVEEVYERVLCTQGYSARVGANFFCDAGSFRCLRL